MGTGPPGDAPAGVWLGLATESKGNNIGNISASLCLPEYPGPLPERLYKPRYSLPSFAEVITVFDGVEHIWYESIVCSLPVSNESLPQSCQQGAD